MNDWIKSNVGQIIVAVLMAIALLYNMDQNHDDIVRELQRDADAIASLERRVGDLEREVDTLSDVFADYRVTSESRAASMDARLGYLEMSDGP